MGRPVVIPINTAITGDIDLTGLELHGIQMPSAWTAADITFQASHDGATWNDLYDDAGTEISITAAASRSIGFRTAFAQVMDAFRYFRVRSGTTGTPVNQAAARTLYLVVRGPY